MMRFEDSGSKFRAIFLVVIFVLLAGIAYAGITDKLERLLEKGEYAEVIKRGEKYLAKKPDAENAGQVRALVIKAEYQIAINADTLRAYEAFEKKYPTSSYRKEITERKSKAYYKTITLPANSIIAFREFREKFPKSSLFQDALNREYALAFKEAIRANSVEAWRNYRSAYPASPRVKEALKNEIEIAWEQSTAQNTINSWRKFQSAYPDAPLAKNARLRELELAWKQAERTNTIESWQSFQATYPDSENIKDARRREIELAWKNAVQANSIDTWNKFRADYPDALNAGKALKYELDLAWKKAESVNNVETWRSFRTTYSGTPLAENAFKREIELAWKSANRAGTVEAMKNFIGEYPDSPYDTQAHYLVCEFAWGDARKKSNAEAYQQFQKEYAQCTHTLLARKKETELKYYRFELKKILKGHAGTVTSLAVSPDGKLLASASLDMSIVIWDISSGRLIRTLRGHSVAIHSIAFSPDGKSLASVGADETLRLWSVSKGRLLKTFRGYGLGGLPNSVAFSPDGRLLASSNNRRIMLARASRGKRVRYLEGGAAWVESIAFSPSGKLIAAALCDDKVEKTQNCSSGSIKVWSVAKGNTLIHFKPKNGGINSISFNPDGKTLASGNFDSTISIWDLLTGGEIKTLKGHETAVESVAFSSDGVLLLSGDREGAIKLWKVSDGMPLLTLNADNPIYSVAISPDGKRLMAAGGDIKIWGINPPKARYFVHIPLIQAGEINDIVEDFDRNGVLYAATANNGVMKSENGGKTWLETGYKGSAIRVIVTKGIIWALIPDRGIIWSKDGGGRWSELDLPEPGIQCFDMNIYNIHKIHLATDRGLYLSTDAGRSWELLIGAGKPVKWIRQDVNNPDRLTIIMGEDYASLSNDGGRSWKLVARKFEMNRIFVIPDTPNLLFAAGSRGDLFRSVDGGRNWAMVGGIGGMIKWVKMYKATGVIFAMTETRLYSSFNDGDSWMTMKSADGKKHRALELLRDGGIIISDGNTLKVAAPTPEE